MTQTHARILNVIRDFPVQHGWPPTIREIAQEVGLSSPATVHHHLVKLETEGMIRRGHGARAVTHIGARCGICGAILNDRRSDARYCSGAHRAEASRRRRI